MRTPYDLRLRLVESAQRLGVKPAASRSNLNSPSAPAPSLASCASRPHFIEKARSYWLYFNVARRNGSKQDRSPLQILQQHAPHVNPRLTLYPTAFLEDYLYILLPKEIQRVRGKDLPVHPLSASGR